MVMGEPFTTISTVALLSSRGKLVMAFVLVTAGSGVETG
jgi:hypothetical protein